MPQMGRRRGADLPLSFALPHKKLACFQGRFCLGEIMYVEGWDNVRDVCEVRACVVSYVWFLAIVNVSLHVLTSHAPRAVYHLSALVQTLGA